MKHRVHIFSLSVPKTGPLLCSRCNKEYDSTDLVCGMSLDRLVLEWYCPTDDCHGTLNSGIYPVTVTTC